MMICVYMYKGCIYCVMSVDILDVLRISKTVDKESKFLRSCIATTHTCTCILILIYFHVTDAQ